MSSLLLTGLLTAILWASHVPMTCDPTGVCTSAGSQVDTVIATFADWDLCRASQQTSTHTARQRMLVVYQPSVGQPFPMLNVFYTCYEPGETPYQFQGLTFTFPPKRPS